MKKLLFQFDTDSHPSVFDTVVAYDGGADHVIGHGGLTPANVGGLVDGCIFTRAPKDKKNTAIFIGGSNMKAGQQLLEAVQQHFFPGFQVSVMLDSNGSNTTAAAAVARIATSTGLTGKKAVILAGTGPVGQRAAAMMALEGAEVSITSRHIFNAEKACFAMKERFNVDLTPVEAADLEARAAAIQDANIVLATGAAGVELLKPEHWQHLPHLEVLADANATPPVGIGGTEVMDKGQLRHGKVIWGAIGFGALKLALHRACIGKLFTDNKQVLDAEVIFQLAKQMA
ncbi:NADP-dependent methylenetetrahydromethanopterin/methylenetetrahydrofolate dehydrogenase [Methylomonas sp. SURF-2]|uniref:NADP-dependent methylenetetrahydromethanopterin/methylenetetrahydrofolate dehydrogenase n=1 Tax=Methylomonas subterranea TaxID=2952225 RepID=A0ABT1TFW9_9GAMM|nr:NADP-dependent methylenetetrahydromethanopterin/methylenetetrahydrofolate dehydrogenase [Methylomonas sp. SURF-2]MCQ8103967.1 NADP-dependent methylenetetrahydromethanopterin/methylenetetrahydrofolate dehydrogenase [Methylomonas sp. SURF-2]